MLSFLSVISIFLKKLCHDFHHCLTNREANPSPAGKSITAGIFSKRTHLSHLFIFFILMSYFWLQAHNSYSSFLRSTPKECDKKIVRFVFPIMVLNYLIWSSQLHFLKFRWLGKITLRGVRAAFIFLVTDQYKLRQETMTKVGFFFGAVQQCHCC